MARVVGGVEIEIRGDDAHFERTMRDVRAEAGRTGQTMTREFRGAGAEAAKLNNQIRGSTSAFAGLISVASGAVLAGSIIKAADAFSGMRAKIALSISAADDLLAVERQLYDQAIANRAALEPIVSLYQRIRGSRADLSNEQTLEVTDRFSKSLVISGASAAGAASATLQFSQAIAGGVLRAEEFNSIIESNVRFVKLLADNLGVSVGQIRNLVNEGAITSDVIFKAIRENGADLDAEFTKIPLTVSSALVNVQNAFVNFIGLADQAGGTSAKLAGFINSVADDFDRLADVVVVAAATIGGGVAGLLAARFVSGLLAIAAASGTATGAIGILRAQLAFFGGPVGLAITAVAGAFAFLSITATDAMDKIANATNDYDDAVADLVSTQDQLRGQYSALEGLNRDLAEAIEDGALAAEITADREIDALQLRIDKNLELLSIYEDQAAAALDNARGGRDAARNDFAQSAGLNRRFDLNTNPEGLADIERAGRELQAELAAVRASGRTPDADLAERRDLFLALQEAERLVAELTRRQAQRIVGAGVGGLGIQGAAVGAGASGGLPTTPLTAAEIKARQKAVQAELDALLTEAEDLFAKLQDERNAGSQQRMDEFGLNRAEDDAARNAGSQQRIDEFNLNKAERDRAAKEMEDKMTASIARGLEQGVMTGNWGEALRGILAQSTSDALSEAINDLAGELVNIFKGAFSGAGNSIGSFIGSLFGGGRAAGGSVRAGMRYMVGEQGPEMFVPSVPGMIVPRFEGPASAAANGVQSRGGITIAAPFIVQGSITEDVLPRVQAMMAAQARELPRIVDARVSDSLRRGRY